MPVIAMTKEMGSLGTFVALEVARRLGYEFLRNDIIKGAAREYRVLEAGLVGTLETKPGVLGRLGDRAGARSRRHRAYLEAAVLDAARRDRVVLMGRWSTVFLQGIGHALRIRVCAPLGVRVGRVMARHDVERAEAVRRITVYDEGVRARMREAFDRDWTDPLLYDLVVNTERITLETGVRQVLELAAAPEFQPTPESRAALEDRALAARVRATLKATPATARVDVDIRVAGGRVALQGIVGSEDEQEAVLRIARGVPGAVTAESEVRVFRQPVR